MQVNWKWALVLAALAILSYMAWKKYQEKQTNTSEVQEG